MYKTIIFHIFFIVISTPVCNFAFANGEWPNLGVCLPGFEQHYTLARRGENDIYYREKSISGRLAVLTNKQLNDVLAEEKFSLINKLTLDDGLYVETYDFVPLRDTNPTLVSVVKMNEKFLILYGINSDEVLDLCDKE